MAELLVAVFGEASQHPILFLGAVEGTFVRKSVQVFRGRDCHSINTSAFHGGHSFFYILPFEKLHHFQASSAAEVGVVSKQVLS